MLDLRILANLKGCAVFDQSELDKRGISNINDTSNPNIREFFMEIVGKIIEQSTTHDGITPLEINSSVQFDKNQNLYCAYIECKELDVNEALNGSDTNRVETYEALFDAMFEGIDEIIDRVSQAFPSDALRKANIIIGCDEFISSHLKQLHDKGLHEIADKLYSECTNYVMECLGKETAKVSPRYADKTPEELNQMFDESKASLENNQPIQAEPEPEKTYIIHFKTDGLDDAIRMSKHLNGLGDGIMYKYNNEYYGEFISHNEGKAKNAQLVMCEFAYILKEPANFEFLAEHGDVLSDKFVYALSQL